MNWIAFIAAIALFTTVLCWDVRASSKAMVTMYSRDDCSYCQQMIPVLNKIQQSGKANVRVIKVGKWVVVPTIKITVNGKVTKTFVGFTPYSTLIRYL